jgi:HD-GYP domain-containing protein (c-di-GMP phosphodiesterase class II)
MFDRIKLRRDLVDHQGRVLARRGFLVSSETIAEAAEAARPDAARSLSETFVADDLSLPLQEPAYQHLFRTPAIQASTARVLLAVRLPPELFGELRALKQAELPRYRHALATAAVTVRLVALAAGESRVMPEVAAAALLHDIGMRHLAPRVAPGEGPLRAEDAQEIALHPFLGAYHLARLLGPHPAVEAALAHHWRKGQGYPDLSRPPARAVEVVTLASAFAALTQERSYRSGPFEPRGAVDLLVEEADAGRFDPSTVKLLVHALRGGVGEVRVLRFGRGRHGHAPLVNHHTPIAAPARAWI